MAATVKSQIWTPRRSMMLTPYAYQVMMMTMGVNVWVG